MGAVLRSAERRRALVEPDRGGGLVGSADPERIRRLVHRRGHSADNDAVWKPADRTKLSRDPTGAAGFLDVDNTVANGPEHYFASCDPLAVEVGTYRIAVANYAGGGA